MQERIGDLQQDTRTITGWVSTHPVMSQVFQNLQALTYYVMALLALDMKLQNPPHKRRTPGADRTSLAASAK